MKKLQVLLILATILIAGCAPNLTDMEKSDLLVQAEKIKYSLCNGNGTKFFSLYKDLLETGSGKTKKELRALLDEKWAKQTLDNAESLGATKEEAKNLMMRAEKIVKEMDFYNLKDMEGVAESIEYQNTFPIGCKN